MKKTIFITMFILLTSFAFCATNATLALSYAVPSIVGVSLDYPTLSFTLKGTGEEEVFTSVAKLHIFTNKRNWTVTLSTTSGSILHATTLEGSIPYQIKVDTNGKDFTGTNALIDYASIPASGLKIIGTKKTKAVGIDLPISIKVPAIEPNLDMYDPTNTELYQDTITITITEP